MLWMLDLQNLVQASMSSSKKSVKLYTQRRAFRKSVPKNFIFQTFPELYRNFAGSVPPADLLPSCTLVFAKKVFSKNTAPIFNPVWPFGVY